MAGLSKPASQTAGPPAATESTSDRASATASAEPAARDTPAGRDNLRGAAWMLFSALMASGMLLTVREATAGLDSRMVVFLRSALTLVLLLAAFPMLRGGLRISSPRLHLLRGLLISVSLIMGFFAVSKLPIAVAVTLFLTAPIFATILAGPLQGERVGPRRWAAVAVGFVGTLIILRPGAALPDLAMLSALGSAMTFALALSLSRNLANADGAFSTFLTATAISVAVTLPVALPVWSLPQTGWIWAAVLGVVVFGGARGLADIQAYRHGEAAVIGPITYLRLVILGVAGYVLYAETPDAGTLLGAAIIVGAAIYIAQREALLRRKPREPVADPGPGA
ncbi:MAG: DMT family transporter [Pseudomonadota bacterium]